MEPPLGLRRFWSFRANQSCFHSRRATSKMEWLPISHLVGLGLLGLAMIAVPFVTCLALSLISTSALIIVALWELEALRRHPELAEAQPAA